MMVCLSVSDIYSFSYIIRDWLNRSRALIINITVICCIITKVQAKLIVESINRVSNDTTRAMLSLSNQLGRSPKHQRRRYTFLAG